MMQRVRTVLLIFFGISLCSLEAKKLYVVDIQDVQVPQKLAVLACQGLMNRKEATEDEEETAVFTIKEHWDNLWLETAVESDPDWDLVPLTIPEFLSEVCGKEDFKKILYHKSNHHEVIPQIVTLAGVLDAIPLDIESLMDIISPWPNHEVAFDAMAIFDGFTELEATQYIFDNFAYLTTGVSMMNPGWRQPDDTHPLQHDLVRDPEVGLADFIIKERIFNFFMYLGCVPATEEHVLMTRMMTDTKTSWKKPVEVYGYNDAVVLLGGDLFEAETNCVSEHNMGEVASSGVNNFSFFNRKASIENPANLEKYMGALLKTRQEISDGTLIFDPNRTYMSFIVGDGDNIAFMKGGRRGWMEERVQFCKESGGCDIPLTLSMSPHLLYLAPDLLEWYYARANETGQDVFVLPPSGHLYSYPGMMDDDIIQDEFIRLTQQDCKLMSATAVSHWEWFYAWKPAFDRYFPKYALPTGDASDSCVRSFFATNVPYLFLPDEDQWPADQHFRMLDGDVVVFKPREWRGTGSGGLGDLEYLSVEEMAAEINGYETGSVSHLYLTSDGGMNLETLYRMINMLEDRVKVVNHEELTEMARQKSALQKVKY